MHKHLKNLLFNMLLCTEVDRMCRFLNRSKLLVVMYHGITDRRYHPPFWTQLPVEKFREQLAFLKRYYRVISLRDMVAALRKGAPLPERSALITFDDGFKNNFTVAFPALKELGLPASIFLTTSFIGSYRLLWFDELFLLIQEGAQRGIHLPLAGEKAMDHYQRGELWEAYSLCVETVKRLRMEAREPYLDQLRCLVPIDYPRWTDDIGALTWQDVRFMADSGIIDFGLHTASHRILTELEPWELEMELALPRDVFREQVGREAEAFCFPNGKPGLDFRPEHQSLLRDFGYLCAFSTESALFDWSRGNCMGISRVAAGNDGTSESRHFRLNASGALWFAKGR
ncbi:polysaccharide deacetylase family protein [Citrifermentans bremense]|uniref:polysaccharide deacetylase family protein n=1 Tax=Citrifermentans bremense TaxID=60035 RepID=UPI0003FCF657|nr:polysaccharide deacetylase family protein [Citrifermentans bremense]